MKKNHRSGVSEKKGYTASGGDVHGTMDKDYILEATYSGTDARGEASSDFADFSTEPGDETARATEKLNAFLRQIDR